MRNGLVLTALAATLFAHCDSSTRARVEVGAPRTSASNAAVTASETQSVATSASAPIATASHAAPREPASPPAHTTTIALARQGHTAWVVQPDGDTVSVIDVGGRALLGEVALGPTPSVDRAGRYTPSVAPRAIAIAENLGRAFVTGERSGEVIAIDLDHMEITQRVRVCARPIGLVITRDESSLLVACAADDKVIALDPSSLESRGNAVTSEMPWALALDPDGRHAYATHFHAHWVSVFTLEPFALERRVRLPDVPSRGNRLLSHGVSRSAYDAAFRPGRHGGLWVAHELHGNDTPQPQLDFESTVFPAVTDLSVAQVRTLSTDSRLTNHPNERDGEFGDVISGPRALAFTADGRFALVVAQSSEDVLVIDAERGIEVNILRPLPGDLPQGIAIAADGRHAYLDERNSGDVVVLSITPSQQNGLDLAVDGEAIRARSRDPMPEALRLGQRVFYTANDTEIPVTTNHWISCAGCHPEGTTDQVNWIFTQGPRNTPSNAGGPDGFLFATADRRDVTDYWRTINIEQGGHFLPDDQVLAPYLHALAGYVQNAIPVPPPPTGDPATIERGRVLFERADVGCATCHNGPALSDSGRGNPTLDLGGTVVLHDVGTCMTSGPRPDVHHDDIARHPRAACAFDTPALRGLAESAPYLHDGSAPSLRDVLVLRNAGDRHGHTSTLTRGEVEELVGYLRSL